MNLAAIFYECWPCQNSPSLNLAKCYQNRTGTGKTSRSDRFTGLTGSNRTFKPLLTGSVRNRPVPYKTIYFIFLLFSRMARKVRGFANLKKK